MTAHVEPSPSPGEELDKAIEALARSEPGALDRVFQIAYDDLHALAHARLQRLRPGDTLNTTALVHETYLKVRRGQADPIWRSAKHFFVFSSKAMRHILVDYARRIRSPATGGDRLRITLTGQAHSTESDPVDLLELDEALRLLGEKDPRMERLVECRFFAGMTRQEAADALGVSVRTVERDWTKAKAYLRELM